MSSFVLDYYALGLHPDWEDILIDLIDLELGLADSPESAFILRYILLGYTQREIALMGVPRNHIIKNLKNIRQRWNNNAKG